MSKALNVSIDGIQVDAHQPAAAAAAAASRLGDARGGHHGKDQAEAPSSPELERAYSVALRWIGPLFAATMAVAALDRNNLTYASISLIPALGLTPAAYGAASSVFYASYIAGLVGFGLITPHVGTRRVLACLLCAWGAVAACTAFVRSASQLYALRVLLGACESGALPAMQAHILRFFPRTRMPKPFSAIFLGIALSGILGGPLAAGLLALDGRAGLQGWQWLFLLEGAPAAALGILVWFLLPDGPGSLRGLTAGEREALRGDLAVEAAHDAERRATPSWRLLLAVVRGRFFAVCAAINFVAGVVATAYISWMPLIIQGLLTGTALTDKAAVGASARKSLPAVGLSTIPFAVGALTLLLAAAHAQRRRELFCHAALPLLVSGAVTALFPVLAGASPVAGFVALCVTLACGLASNAPVMSIFSLVNRGPQSVVALPLFEAIAHVGSIIGAPVTGLIVQRTSTGFRNVTIVLGCLIILSSSLVAALGVWVAHTPLAETLMLRRRRRGRVVVVDDRSDAQQETGPSAGASKALPPA